MSIGSILNIAKTALSANQVAIQTISNNISNVDTTGYSRQEAVLEEAIPTPSAIGLTGNGVTVQQIKSYLDQNTQNAITAQNSDLQNQTVYENYLTSIQGVFNEDNSNLSASITTFFNDWQTLSTDPTSAADKQTVASDGQNLSTTINTMYNDLTALQTQANGDINSSISDVNTTLTSIASLNQEIAQGQVGTSEANDYIDQRNQLLQTLSGYMNINCVTGSNNMVTVLTSTGKSLVQGNTAYQLTQVQDPQTGFTKVGLQDASGNVVDITGDITGGSLGALITTRDTTINGYISDLNGLARSITQNVNYFSQMGNGGTPDQSTNTGTFFQPVTDGNYAENMALSNQIMDSSGNTQVDNVMTTSSTTDATDNDVALAIASLANDTALGGNTVSSTPFASSTTALGISGNLAVNGVAVAIGAGDSLSNIATTINGATGQTGVTASVTDSSTGYQLVLTAAAAGDHVSVVNGDLDASSQSLLQTLTSTSQSSTSTALNLTGDIQLGQGQSVTVSASDTLQTVVNNINTETGATGVTASISNNELALSNADGPITVPTGTVSQALGVIGATYTDYEAGVVSQVGEAVKSATDLTTYSQNAMTSLQSQQASESGVSIDEEMSNLVQYQNAYEAAARLYTVAQDLMDTLMNAMGVTTT
ncbi:MAG: flagellar hook-associated protein FlgK [Syntrophorhabdales bacterium]